MRIDIITLFPDMFEGPFRESIIKRAQTNKLVEIKIHNLRDFTFDKRHSVDDHPYGGGTGMIMMIEPIDRAINAIKTEMNPNNSMKVLLSPRGRPFTQDKAKELSLLKHLILICGHYEGVDERVNKIVDQEISIGDYILTGGEIPAMVIIDSIVRLIPGVLPKKDATLYESFSQNSKINHLLEYPQYTHPFKYKNLKVPKVLLSGNHKKIEEWREKQTKKITQKMRPELIKKSE